jgi:hypothetical protein
MPILLLRVEPACPVPFGFVDMSSSSTSTFNTSSFVLVSKATNYDVCSSWELVFVVIGCAVIALMFMPDRHLSLC